MSGKDGETRTRVLDAAARLFAASGFKKVTVRQICREAGANIAAVNYHFGDKLGLYREVLGRAIETMQGTTDAAKQAGEGGDAEQKLRAYVRVFMQRIVGQGHDSWIHQLMMQEMADPSPALDLVIDQVILPRLAYLTEVVAATLQLPPDDERVLRSVLSVQSQCHATLSNPVAKRVIGDTMRDSTAVNAMADHIADFSLGGIRALRA